MCVSWGRGHPWGGGVCPLGGLEMSQSEAAGPSPVPQTSAEVGHVPADAGGGPLP